MTSSLSVSDRNIQPENLENIFGLIPYNFAKANRVLVLSKGEKGYEIGVDYKPGMHLVIELKRHLNENVYFSIIETTKFDDLLRTAYGNKGSKAAQVADDIDENFDLNRLTDEITETLDLLEDADDAPIIDLINALINQAVLDLASDLHFEVYEKRSVVRFRVDGILRDVLESRREIHSALVSRLKVMANLDIAEKRLPQDGRISIRIADHSVDIRLSTLPSRYGERVVLRLLDKTAARFDLSGLGMTDLILSSFKSSLNRAHGIFLVTGPTGSGKTTSLYSGLMQLDKTKLNIMTVEDPVEYDIDGISQTQVNPKSGLTFAYGLRSILRQDPDVVLIGEIRDAETAKIAIQASLTGHLVLSTLHTNSAIGAITRMIDMGVEPFLISSTVHGILSQRLVRKLCSCAKKVSATDEEKLKLDVKKDKELTLKHAVGCGKCNYLGYRGRIGIYELIQIDSLLKSMVHENAPEGELLKVARKISKSLYEDGKRLILDGKTTIEEVMRVTSDF